MNYLMYNPPCYPQKYSVCFWKYSLNERFIIMVSTFPACDESHEYALQVPNNFDHYVVKVIILFKFIKNYE